VEVEETTEVKAINRCLETKREKRKRVEVSAVAYRCARV
jgi:hypothetical protein